MWNVKSLVDHQDTFCFSYFHSLRIWITKAWNFTWCVFERQPFICFGRSVVWFLNISGAGGAFESLKGRKTRIRTSSTNCRGKTTDLFVCLGQNCDGRWMPETRKTCQTRKLRVHPNLKEVPRKDSQANPWYWRTSLNLLNGAVFTSKSVCVSTKDISAYLIGCRMIHLWVPLHLGNKVAHKNPRTSLALEGFA